MQQTDYSTALAQHDSDIADIRRSAHALHDSVGQRYGGIHPYGHHLDMVADGVRHYGAEVCADAADVVPIMFGAYYHDSIEDARQTYNDVLATARRWMDDRQARMAAEIVYALTNDKGRTRAERAGEHYYAGIRATPYAPMVKLADRLANVTFSCRTDDEANVRMRRVYASEMPHFLAAIDAGGGDMRMALPAAMMAALQDIAATAAKPMYDRDATTPFAMALPKFIITLDGHLRLGMVNQHKELLRYGDKCIGGGYYAFHRSTNSLVLDRASYDFGPPRWHLLETLLVPRAYRGMRIIYAYDDPQKPCLPVSDVLFLEYY